MADIDISTKAKKQAGKDDVSRADREAAIRSMRADFQVGDGPEKPKKKLKLLILVAVALVVVGGGAGGAWMFLLQPPADEAAAAVEAPPEVFEKTYIPADPVFVAFTEHSGRKRQLIVQLTFEVEQRANNVAEVKQALPRLQEALWRSLNAAPLPGADTGFIELTAVKERAREASAALLGPNVVHDVLVRGARVIPG